MDPYRQHPGDTAMVHQTSPYQRPPNNGFANCLCMLLLLAAVIGCIVCAILFTIFLNAHSPLIMVDSFSVSGLKADGSSISGLWDVSLTIRNGNKHLHAYYDEVEVEISYDSNTIGYARIPRFDQSKKSQDFKTVRVAAASSPLDSGRVSKLNSVIKSKGSVAFGVEIKAEVWFKVEKFLSGRMTLLESECKDLSIGIGSNSDKGDMSSGSKKCDVSLQRWRRHWWQRWW